MRNRVTPCLSVCEQAHWLDRDAGLLADLGDQLVADEQRALGLERKPREVPQARPPLALGALPQEHGAVFANDDRGLAHRGERLLRGQPLGSCPAGPVRKRRSAARTGHASHLRLRGRADQRAELHERLIEPRHVRSRQQLGGRAATEAAGRRPWLDRRGSR